MKKLRNIAIAIVLLVLLYTLGGFLILPYVVKSQVETRLTTELSRKTTVERVAFNPYTLKFSITGFKIAEPDGSATFLSFEEFFIDIKWASILKKGPIVKEVRLAKPYLSLRRGLDMRYNFTDIVEMATAPKAYIEEPKPTPTDAEEPLVFSINNIQIKGGSADFEDLAKETSHAVRELSVMVPFISNLPFDLNIFVKPSFFVRVNDTPFAMDGTTKPFTDTRETTLELALKELDLPYYLTYSPVELAFKLPSGTLDAAFKLSYLEYNDRGPDLIVDGRMAINDFKLTGVDDSPMLDFKTFTIDLARADILNQEFRISSVLLERPTVNAVLKSDGIFNFEEVIPAIETTPEDEDTPLKEQASEAETDALKLDVDKIEIKQGALHFKDYSVGKAPFKRSIKPFDLTLTGFSLEPGDTSDLDFRYSGRSGESLKLKGPLSIDPVAARLSVDANNLSIKEIQPYLAEIANIKLVGGAISASGDLRYDEAISFKGRAKLVKLKTVESKSKKKLLNIKTLSVTGIDFRSEPQRVKLDSITLTGLYARVESDEQGGLNLIKILPQDPATPASKKEVREAEAESQEKTDTASDMGDISIGAIKLRKAKIDFVDKQVKPAYRAAVDLDGTVKGITAQAGSPAKVDIDIILDKYAPMTVTGLIDPLAEELFADIKVSFKDFELSSVAPYSLKFIGHPIEKGKLFMDLEYHIKDQKLDSKNNIKLDLFTLGEKIDSPDATKLPIKFALNLLKNRAGEINLKLPVYGDLNDPTFKVGGIVVKMVVNLIVKAATSPFALLGAIAGGGDDISFVEFDAASIVPPAAGLKKLDTLVGALYDRPGLNMEITAFIDTEVETELLRESHFVDSIKALKLVALMKKAKKGAPVPKLSQIEYADDKEYAKYLWKAYKAASFEREKNSFGMIRKQEAPLMEKMLRENTVVTDEELRAIAKGRADVIKAYILSTGKVEKERLFIVWSDKIEGKEKKGVKKSRVEFKIK